MSSATINIFSEPTRDARPAPPQVDVIDWLLFVPFAVSFAGILLVFELIQRIALRINPTAHERSVTSLNVWLNRSLKLVGTHVTIDGREMLQPGVPYIFVSNHQSLFDSVFFSALLAAQRPRFIAKKELGKWIPSISFNLQYGGNAIIDRSNPRQAIVEIRALGERMRRWRFSVVVFAEGTRAKDGVMKGFRSAGVSSLLDSVPEAPVVPIAIDGAWKLAYFRRGPVPRCTKVTIRVLPPIDRNQNTKEIVDGLEQTVRRTIAEIRAHSDTA